MSLNYPNREEWLAVRATPRKPKRDRMINVSTNLRRIAVKDETSGVTEQKVIMMGKGNTYVRSEPKPKRVGSARRERLRAERMVAANAQQVSATGYS